jgi:D-glycero-alpha-D-manno-heptose 1-phosphate guanylyltransferase
MEAIVLAGGFGRRLSHIITDVPKPMADINGKPFLEYIFEYLSKQGITRVVVTVSYKKEFIMDYFKNEYQDIKITYSVGDTPLGTGGDMKKALKICNDEKVFVLNGDTYFDVNLDLMKKYHLDKNADITIASKLMSNFKRYGTLNLDRNGKILSFVEKQPTKTGYINGGIYIVKKEALISIDQEVFSFEKDFMENETFNLNAYANISNGYFIDIGLPEDYYKAQEDFH